MDKSTIKKYALIELAKREFFYFCHAMAPDFYREDRQYLIDLCAELQDFYESEDDILIVNLPPRHGKSRTASLLAQWVFGKNQKEKIMTGSYNETLWQILDDKHPFIAYHGTGWFGDSVKGTQFSRILGDKISFDFIGTKLRIITSKDTNRDNNIKITIDGINYFYSEYGNSQYRLLVFEKLNLSYGKHNVVIQKDGDNGQTVFSLDAIDIDETGSLIDYYQPTDLTATAGNTQVNLTWAAVTGATGYNIKRATTAGGPYIDIATSVTDAVYTDSTVTNGTTYYYVVTTVRGSKESEPSNEVSATPQNQSPGGTGEASLVVTMANGSDQQYNLPMSKINSFINWYNSKATGVGQPYYCLDAKPLAPYTQRTDYLIFDKIVCFKVNQ